MDELHSEYMDDQYVIDITKNGDTEINIKISLIENKDKKEFEKWVNDIDDDIFNETWESLSNEYGLKNLNDAYNTENYMEVIDKFKSKAKEIATEKINKLTQIIKF